jgi:hypothetical protein
MKSDEAYFVNRRLLNIRRLEEIVKEKAPINADKIISLAEYETGLTYPKVKAMLKLLFDIGKVNITENDIVEWIGEKDDV